MCFPMSIPNIEYVENGSPRNTQTSSLMSIGSKYLKPSKGQKPLALTLVHTKSKYYNRPFPWPRTITPHLSFVFFSSNFSLHCNRFNCTKSSVSAELQKERVFMFYALIQLTLPNIGITLS